MSWRPAIRTWPHVSRSAAKLYIEGKPMQTSGQNPQECPCLAGEPHDSENTFIGVDRDFGEVSVARCKGCGRFWLHYFIEYEYLTAAGRWFRGVITPKIAASVTHANATKVLEQLDWYFR